MNPRTKNLALAGGAVAVVGFIAVNTMFASPPPAPVVKNDGASAPDGSFPGTPGAGKSGELATGPASTMHGASTPAENSDGTADPGVVVASPSTDGVPGVERRSYAVGQHDLAGFPPDIAPGTQIELWVTWEPPISRGPRLQKLISDVVLERTVPGSVPEAPVTILLSVPANRIGDLIYADGYGRLSAVLPE